MTYPTVHHLLEDTMRTHTNVLGLLAALLLAGASTLSGADARKGGFASPAAWEGLKEYWTVKNGVIIGSTYPDGGKFNTFLCSKKQYKDFELKFQVRMKGKGWSGNSGVQIRSEKIDNDKFVVKGPQCDMGQQYWGSLYGERFGGMMRAANAALVKKVLKENDFNDYYIKCIGKHVTIKLNGETTVDEEFAKLPDEGIIAWQLHAGGPMEVVFRDIQFKNYLPNE
jgi:Domain of Unknown Function (DUF1080)